MLSIRSLFARSDNRPSGFAFRAGGFYALQSEFDFKRASSSAFRNRAKARHYQVLESAKIPAHTRSPSKRSRFDNGEIVDETLLIHAGREKSVAATKTYTGKCCIFICSRAIGERKNSIRKIPAVASQVLQLKSKGEELVERYVLWKLRRRRRGMNYGNSYEFALKLMETCYASPSVFRPLIFFTVRRHH